MAKIHPHRPPAPGHSVVECPEECPKEAAAAAARAETAKPPDAGPGGAPAELECRHLPTSSTEGETASHSWAIQDATVCFLCATTRHSEKTQRSGTPV